MSAGSEMEDQKFGFFSLPFWDSPHGLCYFCCPPCFLEDAEVVGVHNKWSRCTSQNQKGWSCNSADSKLSVNIAFISSDVILIGIIQSMIVGSLTNDCAELTSRNAVPLLWLVGSNCIFIEIVAIASDMSCESMGLWKLLCCRQGVQLKDAMINICAQSDHASICHLKAVVSIFDIMMSHISEGANSSHPMSEIYSYTEKAISL